MEIARITVLYDNAQENPKLKHGWGFSCFIEFQHQRILFDTGDNKASLLENLHTLNIPLKTVTSLVFSHDHYDHTDGLYEIFSEMPRDAKVYVPKAFSSSLLKHVPQERIVFSKKGFSTVCPDVYLFVERRGFFNYEQTLIMVTAKGLVVITGCAHPGITKILDAIKRKFPEREIYLSLGGFHMYESSQKSIDKIVNHVKELGVQNVAPCHCTGEKALQGFQKELKEKFLSVGSGSMILS
jgi:7,8-dihydropterin-6-yl-methyl-4-(beta-D-ribofuranosyl)aminobenzene 5'-phosphate synthase